VSEESGWLNAGTAIKVRIMIKRERMTEWKEIKLKGKRKNIKVMAKDSNFRNKKANFLLLRVFYFSVNYFLLSKEWLQKVFETHQIRSLI